MNAVAPKSGVQAGGRRKSHRRHTRKARRTHRRKTAHRRR